MIDNSIWGFVEQFARTNLKYYPETFKYPDLTNVEDKQRMVDEVVDILLKISLQQDRCALFNVWKQMSSKIISDLTDIS